MEASEEQSFQLSPKTHAGWTACAALRAAGGQETCVLELAVLPNLVDLDKLPLCRDEGLGAAAPGLHVW